MNTHQAVSVTQLHPAAARSRHHRRGRLLSASEEITLARRIERGDLAAKHTMIESNLGLVAAIAKNYRRSTVPFDDLLQEGTIGLIRAVERYDHRLGPKLSTYAAWWIRRSILDAIANSNVIRLPAKANQQLAAVHRAEAELQHTGTHHASDTTIAKHTHLHVDTVRTLRAAAHVTTSLDQPTSENTPPISELIADTKAIDPPTNAITHENHHEVSAMLRLLPKRHQQVLTRRYGLNNQHPHTHNQIGQTLGLGQERSRQLEHEALHRLRTITTT